MGKYTVHISLIPKEKRPELRRAGKTYWICRDCNAALPHGVARPPTDDKGYRHKWGEYTDVAEHPWIGVPQ